MPQRKVERKKGHKYNAKSIEYDGVKFKSRLEMNCYKMLDDSGIPFDYENKAIVLSPGVKYPEGKEFQSKKASEWKSPYRKDVAVRYTPDFVCPNGKWILETKGFRTPSFGIKWRLFKKLLMEESAGDPPTLYCVSTLTALKKAIENIKLEAGYL